MAHDAVALGSLYAESVYFYGQRMPAAEAAKRKRAAFARSKDYTQTVRDLTAGLHGDRWVAEFVKTSTTSGKATDYPSAIYIEAHGLITAEMDKLSESWCKDDPQLVVPPLTLSEAQAESHLLRAHTVKGKVLSTSGGARPFVQVHGCPRPTECPSGEQRAAPPDETRAAQSCFFGVRLGSFSSESVKRVGGNGTDWFDETSWVDGVTNVLWYQDWLSDDADLWRRDPKSPLP